MDNRKVIYKLAIASAMAISLVGCKPKYDEIDNNQVISKPYVLYAGDSSGAIIKTNDGFNYITVFGPDEYPVSAMALSGKNFLFVKKNVHVIENFGPSNTSNATAFYPAGPTGIGGSIIQHWDKYNRVYLAGLGPRGMLVSDSNGKLNSWKNVADTTMPPTTIICSITQLMDGSLIAYDNINNFFYWLDEPGHVWEQQSSGLPASGKYFISHIENTVLAADTTTGGSVYYSTNKGKTFQKYTGLPANAKVISMDAPFDQTILVGTVGKGVYRLPLGSTAFVSANIGMGSFATVPAIVHKYDFYKNDRSKQYVYAATQLGIYRSEDLGENWTKVIGTELHKGGFTSLY